MVSWFRMTLYTYVTNKKQQTTKGKDLDTMWGNLYMKASVQAYCQIKTSVVHNSSCILYLII